MIIHCNHKILDLTYPKIMGILNCTPNSFSDGGDYFAQTKALDRAYQMIEEGADILDIGAESSNPKAQPITPEEEIKRLRPIVMDLIRQTSVPISIDTYHAQTMQAMIDLGVDIINDINGLRSLDAMNVVSQSKAAVILMHLHQPIQDLHNIHTHGAITQDLIHYFEARIAECQHHQISAERIIIDPGFGFGKTQNDQITLLKELNSLTPLAPVLVGLSRKRLIGALTEVTAPKERIIGNISAVLWTLQKGARIFRVHDVQATREALLFWRALS